MTTTNSALVACANWASWTLRDGLSMNSYQVSMLSEHHV